ncbi:MAG: DUF4404 family protein [Gemmatimonadota bacterium]|nr:DUF4404 family protein [Gemmatimonadota bacterium]HEU4988785.1 DUF4404 family protein [Gemmatimonadaceae bacterium]
MRDLHSLLTELHHSLQGVTSVPPETHDLLERLADDIRPIVEQGPGGPIAGGKASGLRERLDAAMAAVETSHPQLAKTIEHVADTLAFYNL